MGLPLRTLCLQISPLAPLHPSLYVPLVFEEPFPLCSYAPRPLIKVCSLLHFASTRPLYFHSCLMDSWKMETVCEDEEEKDTKIDGDKIRARAFVSVNF